jgi:hypothetical protein
MKICPRTIDKPLLIIGLELEDIAMLIFSCGVPALIFNPTLPLIIFFCAWPSLVILKRGKPEGYVLHILYSLGMNLKGLLPSGDSIRYSPFSRLAKDSQKENN